MAVPAGDVLDVDVGASGSDRNAIITYAGGISDSDDPDPEVRNSNEKLKKKTSHPTVGDDGVVYGDGFGVLNVDSVGVGAVRR